MSPRNICSLEKSILIVMIMLLPMVSLAGSWQSATKVNNIIFEGSSEGERIYVVFENAFNPDNCAGSATYSRIHGNTPKGKYLISAVMTAKAAQQTVTPLLSGCDDWNRPRLEGLWVK
jgi:hypothetical protein